MSMSAATMFLWVGVHGPAAHALSFDVEDLGVLPGDSTSVANAVNGAGEVAGNSQVFLPHAFRWTGVMEHLGNFGGPDASSTGYAINDAGFVVGSASSPAGLRAYLWTPAGLQDLGTLPGYDWSWAYGINSADTVVGQLLNPNPVAAHTGFVDDGSGLQLLSDFDPALTASLARDINDAGQIVGWTDAGIGRTSAFLLEPDGTLETLGTLGGDKGEARAVNELGEVVGMSTDPAGRRRAFLWRDATGMVALPDLGGDTEANGINDAGWVVGFAGPPLGGRPTASLWVGGAHVELGLLIDPADGWILESANGVNEAGQIAAKGLNGPSRALLLTPIPAPLTITAPVPGAAGVPSTVTVEGATPGASVYLVLGKAKGITPIPPVCPGLGLDVAAPRLVAGPVAADAVGAATLVVDIPAAAAGKTALLQALATGSCEWSEVLAHTF